MIINHAIIGVAANIIANALKIIAGWLTIDAVSKALANTGKKLAAWEVAKDFITQEIQKITLEDMVKNILRDTDQGTISKLKNTIAWKRAEYFVEFLKAWNIKMAEIAFKANAIDRDLGRAAAEITSSITWSFGFGWLSWVALSELLNKLVADQMRNELTKILKDKEVSDAVLGNLYKRGYISKEYLANKLAERGFNKENIDLFIKYYSDEVSNAMLGTLYKHGFIDKSYLVKKLKERRFDDENIDLFIKYYTAVERKKERDLTVSTILKAWQYGLIDNYKTLEMLKQLGYDEEEAELILAIKYTELQLKEKKNQE